MRKIKAYIQFPWAGIPDDEFEFEFEVGDDATEDDINEIANEVINEMIWNRIDCGWEEI